ncbi:hypothetical protein T310_9958, partial [Rasamsonia emersonii CBS 393.64]
RHVLDATWLWPMTWYENSQQKRRYGSRNECIMLVVLILKQFTGFMLLTPISVILDARLSFTVVKGVAITLAFASKEELARWAKIKLPDSEPRKKCEMSTERIGTNYEFEGGGDRERCSAAN